MVSNNLLDFAAKAYNFRKETLNFISESTNQIYSFQKDGKTYALRFSNHTNISAINAEMDWLYYLAQNNIGVALPLKLEDGALAISTQDGEESYILTAFEFVPGQPWNKNDPAKWNETTFYNWGKVMGDIHRLTKDFTPVNEKDIRLTFEETWMTDLPEDDAVKANPSIKKIVDNIVAEMKTLPKDKDCYGLIHNDMHPWNFFIDGDKINVFDFDDAVYGWYALDIGLALYHGLWWGRKNDAGQCFTNSIIENFLKGYLSANPLSDFWLSKIPLFMKFRQICKFTWFYGDDSVHDKERISNIEKGVLFSDCEVEINGDCLIM